MKELIIDISDWENFDNLHKNQIEIEAYLSILYFLSDKNITPENALYKYYEEAYLNRYFEYFDLKGDFNYYLTRKINKAYPEIQWVINFARKEAYINEK